MITHIEDFKFGEIGWTFVKPPGLVGLGYKICPSVQVSAGSFSPALSNSVLLISLTYPNHVANPSWFTKISSVKIPTIYSAGYVPSEIHFTTAILLPCVGSAGLNITKAPLGKLPPLLFTTGG